MRANSAYCGAAYTQTPGSVEANLNHYVNAPCFAGVGTLPNGTVLTGFTPQQGQGNGTYVTAGSKLTLPDGRVVKGAELSGQPGWLFWRNRWRSASSLPNNGFIRQVIRERTRSL